MQAIQQARVFQYGGGFELVGLLERWVAEQMVCLYVDAPGLLHRVQPIGGENWFVGSNDC